MYAGRPLLAVLALVTGATALGSAQETPKPRRPPASRVESLTIVVDSLGWRADSMIRRRLEGRHGARVGRSPNRSGTAVASSSGVQRRGSSWLATTCQPSYSSTRPPVIPMT